MDLIGVVIKGSQRWIDFGPVHFQPSEITKMGVILALARYLSAHPSPRGGLKLKGMIAPFLIFLIPMVLILKQPDLGTAMSIGAIGFTMVLFSGINFRSFALLVGVGLASLYPAWNHLHDYQKRRLMVLVDPEADPLGSGYHILQSKIAVGSGELFGKGFLQGSQTQLQFLPEHSTDFIFSVLAEEWGFVGCMFVLSLYLALLYKLCRVVAKCRDSYSLFPCGWNDRVYLLSRRNQYWNGYRFVAGGGNSATSIQLRGILIAFQYVGYRHCARNQREETLDSEIVPFLGCHLRGFLRFPFGMFRNDY